MAVVNAHRNYFSPLRAAFSAVQGAKNCIDLCASAHDTHANARWASFLTLFFRLLVSNIVAALWPTQATLYVDGNFYLFFFLAKQNV
jgi:hypothetical protein